MLVGQKVFLRALTKDDLPKLVQWRSQGEVTRNLMGWSWPRSLEQEEQWFNRVIDDRENLRLAIETKAEGRLIGIAGLYRIDWKNRNAVIGIMIGEKEYWEGGYATDIGFTLMSYGFYELNLHRIVGEMLKDNMASQNLCHAWNFTYEGTLRQADFRRNRYQDIVIMSILKHEFNPQWREEVEEQGE